MKKILSAIITAAFLFAMAAIPAVAAQTDDPAHLLILGDSISTGYGLSDGQSSYGERLAAAYGLSDSAYVNLAVDGASSADLVTALAVPTTAAAVQTSDTIILSVGGNDVLAPFITTIKTAVGLPADATNAQVQAALAANPNAATLIGAALNTPAVQTQFAAVVGSFTTNYAAAVGAIRQLSPTAYLYIQTIYNPFSGAPGYETLSTFADTVITQMNAVISGGATTGNYTVLDIYTSFKDKAPLLTNIAQFDIHPNAAGHTAIFDAAYTAITWEDNVPPATAYTVTFNTNGGSEVTAADVTVGEAAVKPADPTRSGYTFGGWYTDAALTAAYDFGTTVTADITLYAKWTVNPTESETETDNPKTGDTSNTAIPLAAAGLALTSIVFLLFAGRKHGKNNI